MKRIMVCAALLGVLVGAGRVWANESANATGSNKVTRADKWWQHSSLKYDPVPTDFMWHTEATYSRGESTGNDKLTSDSVHAALMLRKHVVSSLTAFKMLKSEQSFSVGSSSVTKKDSQNASEELAVDLTSKLCFQIGARWFTDLTRYIENRYNYYGGFQYQFIDNDRYQLNAGLFLGYDDTAYMNDEIERLVKDVYIARYKDNACFADESFRWQATDALTLTEEGEYLFYLNNDGYYRWSLTLGAEFQLAQHVSVIASYTISREWNTFVETAKPYGYKLTDTALHTGLKVTF